MQLSAGDHFPEANGEPILDQQLLKAVTTNLFEDKPAALNALFRFQIGSSTFDGCRIHSYCDYTGLFYWLMTVCGF